MSNQTVKERFPSADTNSKQQEALSPNLPDELSTLLQIDLLLGRTQDFNNRLSQALSDLADISSESKRSIKH